MHASKWLRRKRGEVVMLMHMDGRLSVMSVGKKQVLEFEAEKKIGGGQIYGIERKKNHEWIIFGYSTLQLLKLY